MENEITIQQTLAGLYVVRANGKECWLGHYSVVAPKARMLANDLGWLCNMIAPTKAKMAVNEIMWKD
jgi:hypothetical protein